jgi:uncharacterized protein (DUF2132 family)
MSTKEIYENNPLHGKSLETILNEMVDHYGWEILGAYININCFKTKPSVESSCKFLNKTPWAKEAVEAFYLYKLKNLPKPTDDQYDLPPRDRIVPLEQKPRQPRELSLEDAERVKYNKQKKNRERAIKQKSSTYDNPWGQSNKSYGSSGSGSRNNGSKSYDSRSGSSSSKVNSSWENPWGKK